MKRSITLVETLCLAVIAFACGAAVMLAISQGAPPPCPEPTPPRTIDYTELGQAVSVLAADACEGSQWLKELATRHPVEQARQPADGRCEASLTLKVVQLVRGATGAEFARSPNVRGYGMHTAGLVPRTSHEYGPGIVEVVK